MTYSDAVNADLCQVKKKEITILIKVIQQKYVEMKYMYVIQNSLFLC